MGASYYRSLARVKLTGNWGLSVLVCFLAMIMGGNIIKYTYTLNISQEILVQLPPLVQKLYFAASDINVKLGYLAFIIGGPAMLGNCRYHLNQHDGKEMHLKDLFSGFERWGEAFVLSLLQTIFIVLWTLLFIIPGIIASYRYAMAFFILEENPGMKAKEALNASKRLMKGHKWELFCLDMSFIGWVLLCMLTFGIGYIFLTPYASASRTAFYRTLIAESTEPKEEYRQVVVEF